MMNELFEELQETKSPRLKWMERHGVQTKYRNDLGGDDIEKWEAWSGDYQEKLDAALTSGMCYPCDHPDFVWAETKEAAIVELAKRNGWKLWNEDQC